MMVVVVVVVVVVVIIMIWIIKRRQLAQRDEGKILCIYCYYEKNETYRENLLFFLKHGVEKDDRVDYVIVVNGGMTGISRDTWPPNVSFVDRENRGLDFGAYTHVIEGMREEELSRYDYFFFINTSVRGPFLSKKTPEHWTQRFLALLNKDTRLVGTTINIHPTFGPHVQSMMFVMDRECLDLLRPIIFSSNHATSDLWETILKKEILMSEMVLGRGWNISCMASKYQGLDYRRRETLVNVNESARVSWGDPHFKDTYFGGSVDAYEILFIKTNRNLSIPPSPVES